jgi:hypothetical protein
MIVSDRKFTTSFFTSCGPTWHETMDRLAANRWPSLREIRTCSPISCFNFDMEILSFGIDCAPEGQILQVTPSPIDQSPAANLTFHDGEHLSTIVNTAPFDSLKCSRSNGKLFTLSCNVERNIIALMCSAPLCGESSIRKHQTALLGAKTPHNNSAIGAR